MVHLIHIPISPPVRMGKTTLSCTSNFPLTLRSKISKLSRALRITPWGSLLLPSGPVRVSHGGGRRHRDPGGRLVEHRQDQLPAGAPVPGEPGERL